MQNKLSKIAIVISTIAIIASMTSIINVRAAGDIQSKGKLVYNDTEGNELIIDTNDFQILQDDIDDINDNLGGLRFGTDGDGNFGYYGADDSLIPFSKFLNGFIEKGESFSAGADVIGEQNRVMIESGVSYRIYTQTLINIKDCGFKTLTATPYNNSVGFGLIGVYKDGTYKNIGEGSNSIENIEFLFGHSAVNYTTLTFNK